MPYRTRRRSILILPALLAAAAACEDTAMPTAPPGMPPPRTHAALAAIDSQARTNRPAEEFATRIALEVPGFGGMAFDPTDAARLILYVTDVRRGASARAAVGPYVAQMFPGRRINVEVRRADFDFLELASLRDRVNDVVAAIPGVRFTDVDEFRNRVTIGVRRGSSARDAVETALAANGVPANGIRFEDVTVLLVECTEIDPPPECDPPPEEPAEPIVLQPVELVPPPGGFSEPFGAPNTLESRHRPIEGGMMITYTRPTSPTGALKVFQCTAGFAALRNGQLGFVTNSHCSRYPNQLDSASYYQPAPQGFTGGTVINDVPIGIELVDAWYMLICANPFPACRSADANWVFSPQADLGHIAKPKFSSTTMNGGTKEIDPVNPKFTITAALNPVENEIVNKVGSRTGWTVGLVTRLCVDWYDDEPGHRTLCVHRSSLNADHGDSGSPVFRDNPNFNVTLVGLMFAGAVTNSSAFSGLTSVQAITGPLVLTP